MAVQDKSAARAAAEWWAERIGCPVHKVTTDARNDPDREYGDFVFMAMAVLASNHPVSQAQGEKFAAALEDRIDKALAGGSKWISLGVDYGPDLELAEAADEAGVDYSRFPFKTHMTITPNYVTASLGYRGHDGLIWQSPDWQRPACDSMGYDERTRLFAEEVCGLPRFHDGEHGDWKPDTNLCALCGITQAVHWNQREPRPDHIFKRAGEVDS